MRSLAGFHPAAAPGHRALRPPAPAHRELLPPALKQRVRRCRSWIFARIAGDRREAARRAGEDPGRRMGGDGMRFTGTTVIITGAAGGLGSAMAAAFAAEGGRVAVVDLPGSQGARIADQINQAGAAGSTAGAAGSTPGGAAGAAGSAFFVPCDLADLDRAAAVMRGIAASDDAGVLVNNAAIYPSKAVGDYSISEWHRVQRVNVDAAFVCAQAVLPAMRAAGTGRIVNISSITFFGGLARIAPYVTSKGALVGLTRALARECGPDGITVNAVAPGAFPTAAEEIHPDREGYQAYVLDQQAVKRRGVPADVASAVLFFCAPESSFITGQLLCVDGGWVMH